MSGKNFKNNNFYGKINGFDMASFIKDLDYSIESTEERIGYIREKLGTYNPLVTPAEIKLDEEVTLKWLNNGAIPTDTVKNLLSKAGIMEKYHNSKQGK